MSCKLALVLWACITTSVVCGQDAPKWSDVYTVKGVLYLPYADIAEPFHAWYDEPTKNSRIDYYDGMAKTYQLGEHGYGTSLKIIPFTTEEILNQITCFQVNGTSDNKVTPQAILPDLNGFELSGVEKENGREIQVWSLTNTILEKKNVYTMWLYFNDKKQPVPLKYDMLGYNTLLGSHYDHYYLEYHSYHTGNIPEDIFKVNHIKCRDFPGPGNQHIHSMNPMAEFIHPEKTELVDSRFDDFISTHNKNYADEVEHIKRKEVFRQNVRFVESVNRQNKGYSLAINHIADKTDDEIKSLRGRISSEGYNGGKPFPFENIKKESLPDQHDWRLYGAVTPVKDQAVCGSCWSFGTVGHLEGALFIKNGQKNLVRLSEQALVDCSWGYGNNGCSGGEDFRSYQWILKHGGIPTDADYGNYLGEDGFCHADKLNKTAAITGWVNVTQNDISALRLAIFTQGPISVSIDASQKTFSFYSHGVYYDENCGNKDKDLDHSVLAVGYGTIDGKDYWLVKNSWSTYWGDDGYILMSAKNNNCGVMTAATYVTM